MQTVIAATNRAKFEQASNMIIINLLNVLWKTQWYGIKDFERTNCIHLLLNVSEKLIRDFLDFNNLKTIEKNKKENVTSFAKLIESCRHWIQIGKKESIIMSKFQIFKQFSADLTNIQDIIKARIELAKILDPAFGETLIANDPNALVTYTKIDTIINCTKDLPSLSLSVSRPLFVSIPLLFSRIPVPEVIQNKPASQVHGEQDEALRQHAGRPLRARRSHAVRPRAKPSASHALDELPTAKPSMLIATSRS